MCAVWNREHQNQARAGLGLESESVLGRRTELRLWPRFVGGGTRKKKGGGSWQYPGTTGIPHNSPFRLRPEDPEQGWRLGLGFRPCCLAVVGVTAAIDIWRPSCGCPSRFLFHRSRFLCRSSSVPASIQQPKPARTRPAGTPPTPWPTSLV